MTNKADNNTTPIHRSHALQSQIDRVSRRAKLEAEIAAASESLAIRLTHVTTNTSNPHCMAELSADSRGESRLEITRSAAEHPAVLDEAAIVRLRDYLNEHFPINHGGTHVSPITKTE